MLYLKNISTPQILFIPRDGSGVSGNLTLKVKSTINREEWSFNVIDNASSDLYFNVSVSVDDEMPSGEYEYTLLDGQLTLSKGLLIKGEVDETMDYQNTIEYEQYYAE